MHVVLRTTVTRRHTVDAVVLWLRSRGVQRFMDPLKVYYRLYRNQPPVHIPSQIKYMPECKSIFFFVFYPWILTHRKLVADTSTRPYGRTILTKGDMCKDKGLS